MRVFGGFGDGDDTAQCGLRLDRGATESQRHGQGCPGVPMAVVIVFEFEATRIGPAFRTSDGYVRDSRDMPHSRTESCRNGDCR